MNAIVSRLRHGLLVAENAIRESAIEDPMVNELVDGHRIALVEAEKLRESMGVIDIASEISKELVQDIFRLLRRKQVSKPPGTRWLRFVDFFFSPKTVEEVFKPNVAEWQHEHFEALSEGRNIKARWIAIRYHYSFVKTIGLSKLLSLIDTIVAIYRGWGG